MEIIDKVGPYAGIIGFLGSAILAFLYFSQARDVRRLREWAGRAPERAAQGAPGVLAEPLADEDTDEEFLDTETGEQVEVDEQTDEDAVPPPPPPPPGPAKPLSLDEVRQRREVARRRWRWLSEPRYAALLIGGVVIFGAAAIAAVVVVTGDDSPSSSSTSAKEKTAPIQPSDVTVAVLNGTGIPGLAQEVGGDLRAVDFRVRTVTNASRQGLKRTSVLYTRGNKLKAVAVAKQLRTKSPRPADPQNAALGAGADVIVTVGSDRAPAGSTGSSGADTSSQSSATTTSATPAPEVPVPAPTGTPPAQ